MNILNSQSSSPSKNFVSTLSKKEFYNIFQQKVKENTIGNKKNLIIKQNTLDKFWVEALNKKIPIFKISQNVPRSKKITKKLKFEEKNLKKTNIFKTYKRKEKSLEELTHKFLTTLSNEKIGVVYLDKMTSLLGELFLRLF